MDQAHAGGQTRQGENRRQQHRPGAAEHLVDDAPQGPGPVLLKLINPGAAHAHVGQHGVYQRQNRSGQKPRQNRVAHSLPLFHQPERSQGGGDHQAKIQCGNGVHGVVALGKTFQQGCGGIALPGLGHLGLAPEQKAYKQQHQQTQHGRGQPPADAVHQLSRVQAEPKGHQEKYQGIDRHPQ